MEILVSSKTLVKGLNMIPDDERVYSVSVSDANFLTISTVIEWNKPIKDYRIGIVAVVKDNFTLHDFQNDSSRWDWLKQILNKLDDMPVIIDTSFNKLTLKIDL